MKITKAYNEKIFKGYHLEYKGHKGHISLGRNEYTLFIKGNFVCTADKFKDIKVKALEEFAKRFGTALNVNDVVAYLEKKGLNVLSYGESSFCTVNNGWIDIKDYKSLEDFNFLLENL